MKYNIDGASKGNPGIASYGGVLRDEKGFIHHFLFQFWKSHKKYGGANGTGTIFKNLEAQQSSEYHN